VLHRRARGSRVPPARLPGQLVPPRPEPLGRKLRYPRGDRSLPRAERRDEHHRCLAEAPERRLVGRGLAPLRRCSCLPQTADWSRLARECRATARPPVTRRRPGAGHPHRLRACPPRSTRCARHSPRTGLPALLGSTPGPPEPGAVRLVAGHRASGSRNPIRALPTAPRVSKTLRLAAT